MKSKRKAKDAWDKWYENVTIQSLWDTVKAVIRNLFVGTQALLKKQKCQNKKNLTHYLEELIKKRTNKIKSQ